MTVGGIAISAGGITLATAADDADEPGDAEGAEAATEADAATEG